MCWCEVCLFGVYTDSFGKGCRGEGVIAIGAEKGELFKIPLLNGSQQRYNLMGDPIGKQMLLLNAVQAHGYLAVKGLKLAGDDD